MDKSNLNDMRHGSRVFLRPAAWTNSLFRLLVASVTLVAGLMLHSIRARAEGFRNPPAGAFALGRAGGRIAQIDDSSAAQHNPANLVDLPNAEVQFAPTIADLDWRFSSTTAPGQTAETKNTWKLLPNAFGSVPLKDQQLIMGLGITTPYGIGSEWDDSTSAFARPTGVIRYQTAYLAQLATVNFNPSLAWRINDYLQVGAGLDIMWSRLTLKQHFPWLLVTGDPATPDGLAEAKADGLGYGGNLGVTVRLGERHRLAVTYRSPITVDSGGTFDLNHVPAMLGGGQMHADFDSRIRFPTIVGAGYGIQISDKVRLEVDGEWIQFSNFDHLPLNINPAPPGLPASVPENWKDTFTIGIGGDWRFATNWVTRLSYQYYQSPVPDSTFSPTIVDANQNVVTFGLGYTYRRHSFELAYSPVFYDTRHVRTSYNPAFNGDYHVTLHLFSLAYRLAF